MFAGVPSWERNRKRRSFGGKARSAAPWSLMSLS
jgi:hypothetical protein